MNNCTFWDITPSSPLKVDRLSGKYYSYTRVKSGDKQKNAMNLTAGNALVDLLLIP
jgi:hypothetical protein